LRSARQPSEIETVSGDAPERRRPLRSFIATLVRYNPSRLAWVLVVSVGAALGQGVGLVLLVPMLEVAGVGKQSSSGGLTGTARRAFGDVGLSLTIRTMLVAYVVVIAIVAVLSAYQSVQIARYRLTFVDSLRSRLYAAIGAAEWRHLLGQRQSDLLNVLTVNAGVVYQGTSALLSLGTTSLVVGVQVLVAIRISPSMTGLAIGTGVALTALVWPLVSRSRRLGRTLVASNQAVVGTITGFLDGLKLAKSHGMEAGHVASFNDSIRRSRTAQINLVKASSAAIVVQLVATAVVLAVLVDIALEHFHLPVAQLLVLALIFTRLVPQISSMQKNIQLTVQALPAMHELMSVIAECESAAEAGDGGFVHEPRRPGLRSQVRLENVHFTYPGAGPGRPEALHGVSFDIPARRTTALVGPSGAGKTTLADLTVGLLCPTEGTVTVDGRPLIGSARKAWRATVGMAPQDPFLFHDTIRANLTWARPDAGEDDLWTALDVAAAAELVRRLPLGLETVVGDRGTRLSGGERQRIALARALLREPDFLVLDEATSSLDTEHELAIRHALTRLHGQLTILVIAHRLSTVRHADAIIVIDDGQLVENGTWVELADSDGGRLQSLIAAGTIS
jgi:ATP-binding cassette subfamily C protein